MPWSGQMLRQNWEPTQLFSLIGNENTDADQASANQKVVIPGEKKRSGFRKLRNPASVISSLYIVQVYYIFSVNNPLIFSVVQLYFQY